ncbi:MAG TPA: carboxypeptidase regulatory-like domain-containing protein [Candidatus Acidoferrum sp.]|nr:carboxypeptidase regulatory-like domain-containing protein [Candidatus Acidoferrum sp.]
MFTTKRNYNRAFTFPNLRCSGRLALCLSLCSVLLLAIDSWAGVGGSISGTVTDSSGAVVVKATVTATNADTGIRQTTATDGKGFYSFPNLPIGNYELEVASSGFRSYRKTGIVIDANSALRIDTVLIVGERTDTILIVDPPILVDTSSTQNGEVISGAQMTSVPLNGRSFTDLLALQPGVVPVASITGDTVQDVGASVLSPSGDLNPGTISINGQREFANSFIVNGSDVEEDVNNGASVIPNLDSIAEFRILTNNFDAEYGEFSGGQINVVTKSGANAFHGDGFEFLRNTNLDARNYFSPTRGTFEQNQFGGTFGGPIRKDKIFFFGDYQGTRSTQGVDSGQIPVPSVLDRTGNLSDLASSFVTKDANGNTIPTTVSGAGFASTLSQKLGYTVTAGENYFTPGCASSGRNPCVFPEAVIPQSAWSTPAQNLLKYIPSPTSSNGTFSTSAFNQTLRDDKGAYRADAETRWGLLSAYYFLDDWSQNNPYPVAQGGANVPGFNANYAGRTQLISLGDTKTLSSTAVNEFHFSYLRNAVDLGKPIGGLGVSLASQGFTGILPLSPKTEGVESVAFNSFTIGTNTNELNQIGNTYQWLDNFSKVFGRHTIKTGGEFHYDQVNVNAIAQFNGSFLFFGTETGSDFADFLLGAPSQYNQSQLKGFYGRNKYLGLFAQDSWRLTRNLTLNYGLRWDRIEPWYEKYNQIASFIPNEQSVVFPNAPAGIVYPGDPGVSRTLAPSGNHDFAPRIGLAYSPNPSGDGMLAKILGGPGKTSIRASYGIFYTAIEALSIGVMSANASYGSTYTSPAPPQFANPFVTLATGQDLGQAFPLQLAPLGASAKRPDTTTDFSQFEPISGLPNYPPGNRIPYTEEYMLSIERGLGASTVLSLNYVGNQGHRLLVLEESNPGDPALCLFLSSPANLAAGQIPCGPFGEDTTYKTATGTIQQGTRGPLGPNFGSNANQATIGNSNYNALQVTLRHTSKDLTVLAGYTFSKSQDQSSNLGEAVNPLNPSLSKALSSFDVKHNLVVSYSYQLPLERLLHISNRWTQGWELSGITRFSSGLPVTLVNFGDNSLIGAEPNGVNNFGVDEPDYLGGPLKLNGNPRNGRAYFDAAQFPQNALGTPGTAKRRFFYGPGMDNYDIAILKNVRLTEAKSLQFRVEAFNAFNHAQFFGPQAVDGNIDSSTFGSVVSAAPPRLVQLGAKFFF